jgi:hypothetical protein
MFIVETPIPKAKRSGLGKLNNPAKRRVHTRDSYDQMDHSIMTANSRPIATGVIKCEIHPLIING